MAEQERKTFKWGDQEYLVDDLLALHRDYENSYYNFARDEGQYDDASLGLLRADVNRRINAIKNGESFDADGAHANDKVNNVSIQTQKKGLFKKDKYVDQDINEWGKHYFSRLMKQMKPHQKKEKKDTGTWDINKYGFGAYLTGQGINARDIFEKYDLRDKDNPDNPRTFTQRDAELLKYLDGYKTWLIGKGFDFTKNDNEWDDNHMTTVESMIANSDWDDRAALAANLRKIGAGDQYTTSFTSDKWDLSKTNEQLDEEAKKRKEEEAARLKNERLRAQQDKLLDGYEQQKGNYYQPVNYQDYKFGEGVTPSFMNYYSDLNAQDRQKYGTYLGTDNQTWQTAYDALMKSLREGTEYSDKNKGVLLQRYFEDARNGFTDLGDGTWLINESVGDSGTAYVYDPRSGYLQRRHLSEFANSNSNIKRAYEDLLYKHINNEYGTDYNNRTYVQFEMGGVLKAQLGAAVLSPYDVKDQYREKAAIDGVSTQTQIARDNYMNDKHESAANAATGWDDKAKARLGYAIADLTSAVSAFVPVYGTTVSAITGVGSTIGNFFTDMADDAVTAGQMWKNLGLNLGMDALGLIPGGGAASKMGKIVKGLKTVVPIIVATPGVVTMLANSPEIAQSWKKAFDGDPENGGSKMTYQDYMNILQVLNVAAGATNIARNTYKSAKVSTKQPDKLAIDVVEKGTTNRRALVLEGDDVTKFKEANAKGEAQKFLDEIEGGHKFTINEVTVSNKGKFWGKGDDGKTHLFHQNPFGRTGTGSANTLEIKFDNRTGKYYADTGWKGGADLTDTNLVSMKGRQTLDQFKTAQQGRVDSYIKNLRTQAEAYGKKTAKHKEHLTSTESKIKTTEADIKNTNDSFTTQEGIKNAQTQKANDIEAQRSGTGRKDALQAIRNARAEIARLEAEIATIKGRGKMRKIEAKNNEIGVQKKIIEKHDEYLKANSKGALVRARKAADAANTEMSKLTVETAKLQNMLARLNTHKRNLETRINTHSSAFDRLVKFKPMVRKFNDVDYTFGTKLDEAALLKEGLFKQGGSINRNKINKFLNYAKG